MKTHYDELLLLGAFSVRVEGDKMSFSTDQKDKTIKEGVLCYAKKYKREIVSELVSGIALPRESRKSLKALFEQNKVQCLDCPHWQRLGLCRGFCKVTGYETSILAM